MAAQISSIIHLQFLHRAHQQKAVCWNLMFHGSIIELFLIDQTMNYLKPVLPTYSQTPENIYQNPAIVNLPIQNPTPIGTLEIL